ncbi:sensor histidine kinase [Paenibacillus roseipurpureus]|uniref:histidine kinase n=1 Tax=Paenibacillus roseopurpureus TaxID=2918901 RepID=A0AA96LRH3_9BACL|nr:sensor histidine kinase [Paenibacillus sp. MBLB1832]WNR45927.1 sensor histidine kinase [Paenibacillus sp. MBLB1832]
MIPFIRPRKYKDWSIKSKLLIMTGMLILCSVIVVSLLSYIQYTGDFEKRSADSVQQIMEQVSLNIDSYLDDLSRLSVAPYRNREVMAALEKNTEGSEIDTLIKTRTIESFLDEIMIIPRNDIINVFVLTDSIYASGKEQINLNTTVDYTNFDWYRSAYSTRESIFIPTHLQQIIKNPKRKVFSIVSQLRSTKDTERIIGVIKVDANYSGIESICNKVRMGEKGGLFIIDGNRNLIFSNFSEGNEQDFYSAILSHGVSNTKIKQGKESYLLNAVSIPRSNWTIVAINSVSELNKNASQTRNKAYLMALFSSLLAILVLIFFIKRFLNPLLDIVKLTKEINRGNLSITFPEHRNDEIGYLSSSFNKMILRIKDMFEQNTRLVGEVYEANFLQKEAQITALFNQIRPHFIFNTLNMISLLMQSGKQEKAVDHINKLSSLLRSMATWDTEITVGQEMNLLHAYLSIQKSRFEGRLMYSISIDESLFEYQIPSFLLQPAVENAVIHGCERKRGMTNITIRSKVEDDLLYFYIEDDGKGMDATILEKLRVKVEQLNVQDVDSRKSGTGIGLINVNKRIKMKYGVVYGLSIDSIPDRGTCVTITLPRFEATNNLSSIMES